MLEAVTVTGLTLGTEINLTSARGSGSCIEQVGFIHRLGLGRAKHIQREVASAWIVEAIDEIG